MSRTARCSGDAVGMHGRAGRRVAIGPYGRVGRRVAIGRGIPIAMVLVALVAGAVAGCGGRTTDDTGEALLVPSARPAAHQTWTSCMSELPVRGELAADPTTLPHLDGFAPTAVI